MAVAALVRDVVALVRSLPAEVEHSIVAWSRRVLLAPHAPADVGRGRAVCARCLTDWPCAEWIRLDR